MFNRIKRTLKSTWVVLPAKHKKLVKMEATVWSVTIIGIILLVSFYLGGIGYWYQ